MMGLWGEKKELLIGTKVSVSWHESKGIGVVDVAAWLDGSKSDYLKGVVEVTKMIIFLL